MLSSRIITPQIRDIITKRIIFVGEMYPTIGLCAELADDHFGLGFS